MWKSLDYSEQLEKEVLQRALHQVKLSCVELNYICNRLVVLQLRVDASSLLLLRSPLQRREKGCGAVELSHTSSTDGSTRLEAVARLS